MANWPEIVFSDAEQGQRIRRAAANDELREIIRGVYTSDLRSSLPNIVRRNLWPIVARFIPDALITDRSAGPAMFAGDTLFVVSQVRQRDLLLPGLRISVRPGPEPLTDDTPWLGGLRRASVPRTLVENLAPSRARTGISRTLGDEELADWIAQLAQQHPPARLNRIRDRAREIAESFGAIDRFSKLDDLLGAVQGTRDLPKKPGRLLQASRDGRGWDPARLQQLRRLVDQLVTTELQPIAEGPLRRRAEQPFYEAYFSNFIEGTEFELNEAHRIVYDHDVPVGRPEDAHDVLATYQLIVDPEEAERVPGDGPDLVEILSQRHARLMAARPDRRPGLFKEVPNRVGSYSFVEPNLVRGTLEQGLPLRDELTSAFARAMYVAFLVSEVHPFDDGNGRLARLAMNAELSAQREQRILIPLIIRNDYLAGLRRLSRDGDAGLLTTVLRRAQRWSAGIDFSSVAVAEPMLEQTNALTDATDAERSGLHLLV
ncbi:MAG TPA: cell filamentation protein Fic [Micromonosporaceae bacterium]|nr:cell filamentation protein Fic [Micromonosporaceae bacterium]